MSIRIGSARKTSTGGTVNDTAGDQLQTSSTNDRVGEVSMQDMYMHSKGWYILRAKKVAHATSLANTMKTACNNVHVGYDQNNRLAIITDKTTSTKDTECDCSSLVRECVIEACGTDAGNFSTEGEKAALLATGLFDDIGSYTSQSATPLYNGDILVTKTKGHTVIVTSGNARSSSSSSSSTTSTSTSSSTSSVTASASASSYDKSLAGTYKVTASSGLNVRDGAGSNKKKLVAIPKGTKVNNYGYYSTSSGVKWLYIQFTYNSVKYTGFASSQYLEKC